MELRTLRYFLTVAQTGNISSAAEALHITQPTLSRQLMDLEMELGTALFLRGRRNRSMELTEQGHLLRQRAAEMLELAEKTIKEIRTSEHDITGDLYIGCAESPSIRLITHTLSTLNERYPKVRYHIHSDHKDSIMERLDRGLLDFGVVFSSSSSSSRYEVLHLPVCDTFGLLLRKDHPLATTSAIQPDDLIDLPLLISRQSMLDELIGNWPQLQQAQLKVAAVCNLIYNASLMVEQGMGCALCLEGLINTKGKSPFCFRPFSPPMKVRLDLIWKKDSPLSAAAAKYLELIREAISQPQPTD